VDELTYIWKWDIDRDGRGISDERLDQELAHLLTR
jgi:hypothetical protein